MKSKYRVIILARKETSRIPRRIATELEMLGAEAIVLACNKIVCLNNVKRTLFYSLNKFSEPIEIKASSISFCITYCKHPIIEQVEKYLKVNVSNSFDSISLASNKFRTSLYLKSKNIDVPNECLVSSIHSNWEWIMKRFSFPQIFKTNIGSQGSGVHLVESESDGNRLGGRLIEKHGKFLVQSFVETKEADTKPHDYRLFIVNGKIIATMKRSAMTGIKTNHSIHHASESYEPTMRMKRIAKEVARITKLKVAGVDLAFDSINKVWLTYEINSCPGLGIELVTGINVAKEIAMFAIQSGIKTKKPFPEGLPVSDKLEMSNEFNSLDDYLDVAFLKYNSSQYQNI